MRAVTSARWVWVTPALFAGLAMLVTWPLPLRLHTSIPGDYGDPLFVSWVMGWVARQLSSALTNPASLGSFWDAGMFYPESTTLALSEHFIAQTVVILPVYWLTENLILCYNLVFLAALVLTAFGTTLLVRELTGSLLAGILGGVVASFNEYRLVAEVAHLQTLSIAAFPFALLGVHKFLVTGERKKLVGAAFAWLALNLSSVYYLAYCSPFIVAFALAETWRLGQWRQTRVWRDLAAAAVAVLVLTTPFLLPYASVQKRFAVYRSPAEVIAYSATLDQYRAASGKLAVPMAMGAVALGFAIVGFVTRSQRAATALDRRLAGIILVLLICAMWLSLGPVVQLHGRAVDVPALYQTLATIPGYTGLRVPSRFASVFLVFLGVLAGAGAGTLIRRWPRAGTVITVIAAVTFLWQGRHDRVRLDQALPSQWLSPAPAYLSPAATLPPTYHAVARLPETAVLLEMPFGDPFYELRYLTVATLHHRTLVNGYSGVFPPSYVWRQGALGNPMRDPARAWRALHGATHVMVHKAAWLDDTGERVERWLTESGAREVERVDRAVLLALPDWK